MRVLIVEEAIRDGLRLEAIAADIAGDGETVASGSGMPILMLTAADRLDDKATGFGLGAVYRDGRDRRRLPHRHRTLQRA